ncbi:glycosyltransferase family 2 protein [Lysobacter olei]
MANVEAVIVTYLPEREALSELLVALSPQVDRIHVVDNTPSVDVRVTVLLDELGLGNVALCRLGDNHGIAKALNVGIGIARTSGASHVLLSDQDSLPAANMVAGLVRTLQALVAQGARVGAVAPTFTDRNTGITFPFQAEIAGKLFYGHIRPDASQPVMEALTLITSGMLVPVEVFDEVGDMREDLFIDHVDIEWSHRARAKGWRLFGTCDATMFHRMGDDYLRVWYFGWRRESAYSPLRMYYRIRNFIAICKLRYIDTRWKLRNGWYWLGFVYSHLVFGKNRARHCLMIGRGVRDGILGRMGRYGGS